MKISHASCLLIFAACCAVGQEPAKTESCKASTIQESSIGTKEWRRDAAPSGRRDAYPTAFGSWKKMLMESPAAEMPALAAALVKNAPVAQRESATVGIVEAALEINPTAATLVVGAIGRAMPELAAVAAAAAAAKQPVAAEAICKAATAVAPGMAASIVGALCKVAPESYRNVAVTASKEAPGKEREILRSVGAAEPALGLHLELEIAKYDGAMPPVALVLARLPVLAPTNGAATGSGQQPAGSGFSPANPNDGHTNNGGNDWHGGRNYARP